MIYGKAEKGGPGCGRDPPAARGPGSSLRALPGPRPSWEPGSHRGRRASRCPCSCVGRCPGTPSLARTGCLARHWGLPPLPWLPPGSQVQSRGHHRAWTRPLSGLGGARTSQEPGGDPSEDHHPGGKAGWERASKPRGPPRPLAQLLRGPAGGQRVTVDLGASQGGPAARAQVPPRNLRQDRVTRPRPLPFPVLELPRLPPVTLRRTRSAQARNKAQLSKGCRLPRGQGPAGRPGAAQCPPSMSPFTGLQMAPGPSLRSGR